MKLSNFVLPALMLAVLPAAKMIATASSASGEPPLTQLAQMRGPPAGQQASPFVFGPAGPGGPRPMMGPGFPLAPFDMGAPHGMRASPKALCEGRLHMEAGIRAHLRSRLNLDAGQREAWSAMEALVEPAGLRARELCAGVPAQAATPPTAPDKLVFAENQLGLRLEAIRLLQAPFGEFYQTLTAEQRAVLDQPPMMP